MPLVGFALYAAVAALTFYLLIVGRALVLPIVVAVVFWYLIATLAQLYGRLGTWGFRPPGWLAMTLAILTFVAVLLAFIDLTRENVNQVVAAAPTYQENLQALLQSWVGMTGLQIPTFDELLKSVDLGSLMGRLANSASSFLGDVGLILVYVIFLLIEQKGFAAKFDALVSDAGRRVRVRATLERINSHVRTYIWVKTLLSLATGGISYVVMIAIGLDFAAFWAVLIFLLNYIPTVGSLLGIVLPTLLALVQFPDSLVPFAVVLVALGITQVVIGNVVEPRVMGRSLNLSPLVILVSLALWGTVWGVIGMFLCVPITAIAMIVMVEFRATRPVAVLLSSDGALDSLDGHGNRAPGPA